MFLAFIKASRKEILLASYLIAVGGFLYPFVWLFAALYGLEMRLNEAKEVFALFGYMGGVFFLGIIYVLYLATTKAWRAPLAKEN